MALLVELIRAACRTSLDPPAATDDVLTLIGLTTLLQQNPAHCAALCNTNVGVTAEIKYLRKFWFPSSGQNSLVKLDYRNDHV